MAFYLELRNTTFRATAGKLNALSPLAVLERGYSITRVLPDQAVVKDVAQVEVGQHVEVTVSRGEMVCRVERKQKNGEANI
jgi:exodeoxyribonuclease VII large subunit